MADGARMDKQLSQQQGEQKDNAEGSLTAWHVKQRSQIDDIGIYHQLQTDGITDNHDS